MSLGLEESWLWKEEPWSPIGTESSSPWSVHGSDGEEVCREGAPSADPLSRAELAQHVLDDIDEYVKKEETFSEWLEEKVPLPIFDDIQTVLPVETVDGPLISSTTSLLSLQPIGKAETEVTYVLGHGQLTPPQSPPPTAHIYIVPQTTEYVTLLPSQSEYISEPYVLPQPVDLAREMAVVDEVVHSAAQQFEAWESSDSASRSSEGTEDSDDPEWMPYDSPDPKPSERRARQPRPYNIEDRRQRKKEQNKNAATRYRQKKKSEVNVIQGEERELEDQNSSLETKLQDVNREITYLKSLMRELFKAKGLLK